MGLRLRTNDSDYTEMIKFGEKFARTNHFIEATNLFSMALSLKPEVADAHVSMGLALDRLGDWAGSIREYNEALRLSPGSPVVLNNLAWELATCPKQQFRDGKRAVQLAEQACALTSYTQPLFIGTLAASHAETGDFQAAVLAAKRAADLAAEQRLEEIASKNRALLELYRQGKTADGSVRLER
jgi:Tfp pilus assembly protein PilF